MSSEQSETKPRAEHAADDGAGRGSVGLDFLGDVPIRLTVELGGVRMQVRDVLALAEGSIVELDRMAGDPADVLVNGRLIARGELTVVEERLAIRLVELVGGRADQPD
ncbi:MAG: flagellar motor switch protein FliN [Myxococcota bacterium]|nr:flagellar motor switch protein FliN [Myxococcota bacterium]